MRIDKQYCELSQRKLWNSDVWRRKLIMTNEDPCRARGAPFICACPQDRSILDVLWHYLETRKTWHSNMQPYILRKIQKQLTFQIYFPPLSTHYCWVYESFGPTEYFQLFLHWYPKITLSPLKLRLKCRNCKVPLPCLICQNSHHTASTQVVPL